MAHRHAFRRRREKRISTEANRLGTDRAGHGWAAKQAAKRANIGKRVSMRTIRKRMKQRGGGA